MLRGLALALRRPARPPAPRRRLAAPSQGTQKKSQQARPPDADDPDGGARPRPSPTGAQRWCVSHPPQRPGARRSAPLVWSRQPPSGGAYDFYKAVIDAPQKRRPPVDAEEAARRFEIGSTYNRMSRR